MESDDENDSQLEEDSDDDYTDSDEGADSDEENETSQTNFTFLNPYSSGVGTVIPSTNEQLGRMAIYQGVPKNPKVQLRFIIGTKEFNRFPGKAPGEIDLFKRKWTKLMAFSAKLHWRRVFHNSFEGDYYHNSMPFSIDGIEWKTVTHYLLSMLYRKHELYADKFSLRARHLKDGWWGRVKTALLEHNKNIAAGLYAPDPDFPKYLDGYLQTALLAKFTQHADLKHALLLTEDAVFAVREGEDKISDFPALARVREIIANDPTLIFKGQGVPPGRDLPEIPFIASSEELNFNYVDLQAAASTPEERSLIAASLVAGGVRESSLYDKVDVSLVIAAVAPNEILTMEPLLICDQIVYVAAGAYDLNLSPLLEQSEVSFVNRHLYALERIADNQHEKIMVALQTTPCSQTSNYLHFLIAVSPNLPAANLYLEPLKTSSAQGWNYGIQIVCERKDSRVLDYLRELTKGSFVSPAVLAEKEEDDEEEFED